MEKNSLAIDIRSDGSLIISPKLEQSEEDLKDELVEKATSFSNGLDFDDKAKIKDMIRIAENCKDMAAFI